MSIIQFSSVHLFTQTHFMVHEEKYNIKIYKKLNIYNYKVYKLEKSYISWNSWGTASYICVHYMHFHTPNNQIVDGIASNKHGARCNGGLRGLWLSVHDCLLCSIKLQVCSQFRKGLTHPRLICLIVRVGYLNTVIRAYRQTRHWN